jgi:NAD(P)-dependent dehydrogenase (short-subunit alcohol dehydrogenase family)
VAESAQRIGLVTGGASGIGRASAQLLASEGAHVAVLDTDREGGESTVQLIGEAGGSAEFILCDVSDPAVVEASVGDIVKRHGRLDFAHNNAGVCPVGYSVDTLPGDVWDHVIGINLKGVWLAMKFEATVMREQGSGAIVNTSSVCGLRATAMSAPYNTSKHGVIGLTLEAALDLAPFGVRVNAVLPGAIDTAMARSIGTAEQIAALGALSPLGRIGEPEDIAAAVAWLLSDAAAYVTGHSLVVDGGLSIPLPGSVDA